jgi:hypothetical protein
MTAWFCGLLAVASLAAAPAAETTNGERIPPLRGKSLSGHEAIFPEAAGCRFALLLLDFT